MKLLHITAAVTAAALSCALAAHAGVNISPPTTSVTLKRGSSNVACTPVAMTLAECEKCKANLIAQDALTKTSGQTVYLCSDNSRTVATFTKVPAPKPTCTESRPAVEGRPMECPPGTVGAWTQTRGYEPAAYPTCWTPGEWTPATAPAGICATPQTLVYACADAGADGRILESATVSWPNCQSAGYHVPSKLLVVATNGGTRPFHWCLASQTTTERIWTQTGEVGDWLSSSAITWLASPNRAPVISGQPATSVGFGSAYTFTPAASDADADALTFSVVNKPAWATFSASTGKLAGTPGAAQVGAYSNIAIAVSDGKVSATLPAFAIIVTANATGSATLSWTPPTQNTDGSALTDLAGYQILYGTAAAELTRSINVPNPSVSTYIVERLSPATWYFAMRAYTSGGGESELSNVTSTTIR